MEIRCYICDSRKKIKFSRKDNKPLCGRCRTAEFDAVPYGKDADIKALLRELEARLPYLFNGLDCPGNCKCSCTNKTGCLLLTQINNNDRVIIKGIDAEDKKQKQSSTEETLSILS